MAITLNTEGSPRNTRLPCLLFGNTPLIFIGVSYCSDITTPPAFARDFPFLNYSARPITRLKARVWRFNTREYNYIQDVLKWPPPPILGQGEPPQGIRLYHAPFFQNLKGCHITLKNLILIVFYLSVNFLFVPLIEVIKHP